MKRKIEHHPFVSVIICTYNRAQYLERCIESLEKQTYPHFEIIVVNGPSTDETNLVLKRHRKVSVIKQKELNGIAYARNLGIVTSKGEIIAFIDDDAVADKNWLEYLVRGYISDLVGGVGGPVYGPQKRSIQFANGTINRSGIPSVIRAEGEKLRRGEIPLLMGTNCSFRRDALYNLGGFDPYFKYYHDESDFCARIVHARYRIVHERRAYVIHDKVKGYNRRAPYDLNWTEVIKNLMYFIMKNYGDEIPSYTVRPAYALAWWFLFFQYHFFHGRIKRKELICIYRQVLGGAVKGYRDGLKFNLKNRDKNTSFLNIRVDGDIRLDSESEIYLENPSIKIALLSQEYSKDCNGGICRYTYDLAHGLADLGNEVHIISKSEHGNDYDYLDGDVYVHKIGPQPTDFLGLSLFMRVSKKNVSYSYAASLKLLELIETRGIQIVEAPLWDAEGFVFSLVKSVPLVVRIETPLFKVAEIHGWKMNKDMKLANRMEGEAVRRADRVIAISKDIGTLIRDYHHVPEEKIALGPLGIEPPDEDRIFRNQKKDAFDVLFVGRLEKRKGIDTLIKAVPSILDHMPQTTFTIVGGDTNSTPIGGSYKRYVLKMLDKKYHQNVDFVGFVPDEELKRYYQNCDIFVAPSLYESFGLIYLEAMAWGKPVIGCDAGGVPEIIEEDITGILIPPDSATVLAEAILKLKDEKLRAKIGEKGRKKVENDFSMIKMAENTYNIYRDVINSVGVKNSTSARKIDAFVKPEVVKNMILECMLGR